MKKVLGILLFVGSIFIAHPAIAADYYIDGDNGNDADAGTEVAPWKSLSKISSISSGDTVYVKGEFAGLSSTVTIPAAISGSASATTTITNWPGESPLIQILSGSATISVAASYIEVSGLSFNNNGTLLSSSNAIKIEDNYNNVTVADCTIADARFGVYAVAATGIQDIIVEDNTFSNTLYGIWLQSVTDSTVRRNHMSDNLGIGVGIVSGSTSLIVNNVVTDNGEAGVYCNGVSNCRIINNTIYDNGYGAYGESCTGYLVKNNIIVNSSYAGISNKNSTSVSLDYNLFHGNSNIGNIGGSGGTNYNLLADWQAINFDEHSIEGDPLFVDVTNSDFHIPSNSPAIDTGLDVANFHTTDFDSETRPYGLEYDIGADEVQTPDAPTDFATATVTSSALELTWTAPGMLVTSYEVEYDTDENFTTSSTDTGITTTQATIDSLTPNTVYYVRVFAVNATSYQTNYSEAALLASGAGVATLPEPPSDISNTLQKPKKLTIGWTAPSDGVSYYKVGYSTDSTYAGASYTNQPETTFAATDLTHNTPYYFQVQSCNVNDECSAFETAEFRTLPRKVKYVKPLPKTATKKTIKIRWQKVKNAQSYRIKLMWKKNGKNKKRIITVENNKTNDQITLKSGKKIKIKRKKIKKLVPGKKYRVKVRALFDDNHKGKFSDIKRFTK